MSNATKLTAERQARICQAIQLGAEYAMAAQFGGVDYSTMRRWIVAGDRGRAPYRAFREAVKDAEARAVVGWLAKIEKAASDGEWTAAAWKLERRYPHVYGRRVQEVTGADGAPLTVRLVLGERALEDAPAGPRALEAG